MAREFQLNTCQLPLVESTALLRAPMPFIQEPETAPVHQLIYLTGGSMQIIEEGTEYRLLPGSFLFLQAGYRHWGTEACAPDTAWYYVHFTVPPAHPPAGSRLLSLPKFLNEPRNPQLEQQLRQVGELFTGTSPIDQALCNVKFYEILLQCCRQDLEAKPISAVDARIHQVIDYLKCHLQETLDTTELSAYTQITYKHLGTVFKEHTGHSILEHHTLLRMEAAAKLLRETDLTITQISEKLGFGDAFYFSNVFKKVHGLSPRAYRQKLISPNNIITPVI